MCIGYDHIKKRRLEKKVEVAAGGTLGTYVPFNFCNRSVVLYRVWKGHQDYNGGQQSVIHLVSDVETAVAAGKPWAFTDRHADLGYTNYSVNLSKLHTFVDWSVMPMRYWGGDDDRRQKRQAEFLIHDRYPWDCFTKIGVYNTVIAARVKKILASSAHCPPVAVKSDWYY